ncbi:MAG: MBL fold metallo-hydrolase [Egibacteraceae bacterium]
METRVDEIADGIYRLSTWFPDVALPAGFTFNQFLVDAEEPLLFHTGQRMLFPLVSAAAARVLRIERLRWITFGHVEADECGSMNLWLAAAPRAEVAHGGFGCLVSLNDMADRPPRALSDGEVLDLGGKRVRHLDTPHVPHNWEARVLYEETTQMLLCGDLFTQLGDGPALTSDDLVGPAMAGEEVFHATSLGPLTAPTLRRLAELEPRTLALMHGPSYSGDGAAALRGLADAYEQLLMEEVAR